MVHSFARATLRPVTGQLTTWVAQHGVYAVFALMALDALVVPAGGELVMLYAGVLAAGAIAGEHATVLGIHPAAGAESYIVLALAGTLGSLAGSLLGWAIGARGGRPLIERHGSLLHLGPQRFARAEEWFARYGARAVFVGRLTPVVRSFISIPAGVLGIPLRAYAALTLLASLIWCFGLAAAGWAAGGAWETIHHDLRYADYAAVAAVLVLIAGTILHRRRAVSRRRFHVTPEPDEGSG
jgi:membrane protein DedA with SNARE-associated domain